MHDIRTVAIRRTTVVGIFPWFSLLGVIVNYPFFITRHNAWQKSSPLMFFEQLFTKQFNVSRMASNLHPSGSLPDSLGVMKTAWKLINQGSCQLLLSLTQIFIEQMLYSFIFKNFGFFTTILVFTIIEALIPLTTGSFTGSSFTISFWENLVSLNLRLFNIKKCISTYCKWRAHNLTFWIPKAIYRKTAAANLFALIFLPISGRHLLG